MNIYTRIGSEIDASIERVEYRSIGEGEVEGGREGGLMAREGGHSHGREPTNGMFLGSK